MRERKPTPRPLLDTSEILEAIQRGSPWTGPNVEWTCSSLGATTPPPSVALDPEYIEDNGIEVDDDYLRVLIWQVGIEQGYRMGRNDADLDAWLNAEAAIR